MITLYRGIVQGRQRQLKTEGTGYWFSSSLEVAKTYSTKVEVWELDDSLDLSAIQINCNGKKWSDVNTDAYAKKYVDKDVVIFKDVVDVGPLWLQRVPKNADKNLSVTKACQTYFTADDWVVNNLNCIKKVDEMYFKLNENTLEKLYTKLGDKIEGQLENNKEIMFQGGVADYYRDVLSKENKQLQKDLVELDNAYVECNMEEMDRLGRKYLTEGKDYKYIGKIGKPYVQGDARDADLTSDREEATWFESETEPKQIINQMKKDKKGYFASKKNRDQKIKIIKLKESQFDQMRKTKLDRLISPKEKWNLKMDIESLKKELIDLQNTAADLPDEYVREVCQSDSYPLEKPIDDDVEINLWCDEMDELLSESYDFLKFGPKVLQEETAQKYFSYLLKGYQNLNTKLSEEKLDAELDKFNLDRFNDQIKDDDIQQNYFEGKTLSQFKDDFIEFAKSQKEMTQETLRKLMVVFNDYIKKFQGNKLKKYASWKE